MPELILASGSPRRRTLLHQLGLRFSVLVPDIDETIRPGEPPRDYVHRMSTSKFAAATDVLGQPDHVVLCADTVVILDDSILGKPGDEAECLEMLMSLSGREHNVVTSVTLGRSEPTTLSSETIVRFRHLNQNECRDYWATGEPCDKAGGYGIQGIGAIFVESITGSYSNVVGLPLMEVACTLSRLGIAVPQPPRHHRETEL